MSIVTSESAADAPLTTLEAVRAELDLKPDAAPAEYLEDLIRQASAAVTRYCGRSFASESVQETLHIEPGTLAVPLAQWPVVDIVAVMTKGGALASTGYEVDANTGILRRLTSNGSRTAWSVGRVAVSYVAGYEEIPADIERATVLMVRNAYLGRGRDVSIRSIDVDGIGSKTYGLGSSFPAEVAELLAPWRSVGIA